MGAAFAVRKLSPFGHVGKAGPDRNADCTPKPVTENPVSAGDLRGAYRPDSAGCGSSPRGPTTPAISGSAMKRSRPV